MIDMNDDWGNDKDRFVNLCGDFTLKGESRDSTCVTCVDVAEVSLSPLGAGPHT